MTLGQEPCSCGPRSTGSLAQPGSPLQPSPLDDIKLELQDTVMHYLKLLTVASSVLTCHQNFSCQPFQNRGQNLFWIWTLQGGSGKDDKSLNHAPFCLTGTQSQCTSLGRVWPVDQGFELDSSVPQKVLVQLSYTSQNPSFLSGL